MNDEIAPLDLTPLNLVPPNDPLLYTEIAPFDFGNLPTDPIELANQLIVTMNHHNGLGLSANQCGLPYRVFVMRSNPTLVCFNPKIVDMTSNEVALDEGCLSHPYLYVKIKRPLSIKVRFTDAYNHTHTQKLTGMSARCFLHEFDHLQGINYLRRANPINVERAKRAQQKILTRVNKLSKKT